MTIGPAFVAEVLQRHHYTCGHEQTPPCNGDCPLFCDDCGQTWPCDAFQLAIADDLRREAQG